MLKMAESRLSQEKEAILAEQRGQNLLLTNLKAIQVCVSRTQAHFLHLCWFLGPGVHRLPSPST